MKTFTIATIVALASVGTAQLSNIPECALNCFLTPLTSDGCESLTDFACHCKKGAELLSQVQPCVQGACSAEDQAAAISAVESTCAAAGAPITIPDASGAVSSAVASATSAAASAASSVASSAASEASSAASSAASVASSVLSEASSAVASAASSMSVSMSMTGTPTASGSGSATPSASASEFTGGAAQATQAVGILGAAALAMLAL